MVRATRTIRFAAGVILFMAASAAFGADRPPGGAAPGTRESPTKREGTGPARRGGGKDGEARLDTVKIIGSAERPAILFFLPRARFRLLPLRPEPETSVLTDDKISGDPPGS